MILLAALVTMVAGFLPQAQAPGTPGAPAALDPTSGAPAPAEEASLELMDALMREPRVIGTHGYERALDEIARSLRAAGVPFQRGRRRSGRVVPLRSDTLFFEDSRHVKDPFAGVRERWSPDELPTMELPMAFEHNPASSSVRAPVLAVGAGLPEDFERVAGLGVSAEGCIVLAEMPLAPASRKTSVRAIVDRAAEVGALGVLIAPEPSGVDPRTTPLFVRENTVGEEPLALPTMPIRSLERDALASRLRIKRVRGDDGRAVPTRLGPGPVEVALTIECPVVLVEAPEIICGASEGALPAEIRAVPVNELRDRVLGGAFEIAAELQALAGAEARAGSQSAAPSGIPSAAPSQPVVFGAFALPERSALLGAGPALASVARARPARTTWTPGLHGPLPSAREVLGEEWKKLLDAAAGFIDYERRGEAVPDSVIEPLLQNTP